MIGDETIYMKKYDITARTAQRDLNELIEKGILIKTGKNKDAKYLYKNHSVR